jgi:predicted Zn finger-like uncharacterized protein
MLIVCPNCTTSYDVEVASLRPSGRNVRCARCREVWHAEISRADKLIAAAEALAPVRRAVEAVAEAVAEGPLAGPPVGQPGFAVSAEADHLPQERDFAARGDLPNEEIEGPGNDETPNNFDDVESPSIAPVDFDEVSPVIEAETEHDAAAADLHEDIESVAARHFPRRPMRQGRVWPLSRLQSAILALIIADAIIIGWRSDFVRVMPQTASFYAAIGMPVNLRGLNFEAFTTATEQHEGVPILVVEGNIVNTTRSITDVPHLRFAVRNAARQEIYSWTATATRPTLTSGETVSFHSRLASPPPDAHDVLVRFVNRYDIMTGTR